MNIQHLTKTPIAIAIALALAENPLAQATPGDFVSKRFPVTRTPDFNDQPGVATDAVGNAVIVWRREEKGGDGFVIFGQRYRAGGIRVGPEFPISSTIPGDYTAPAVAMDADGDFVVAFSSYPDIRARRFDRFGRPLGDDFLIATPNTTNPKYPVIDSDASGGFIIAWDSVNESPKGFTFEVRVKRFSPEGNPIPLFGQPDETEFSIPGGSDTDVAMDADGDFAITWLESEVRQEGNIEYSGRFTRLQTFDRTGKATSEIITLFSNTYPNPIDPNSFIRNDGKSRIAMDADGDIVLVGITEDIVNNKNTFNYIPQGALFNKIGQRKRDLNLNGIINVLGTTPYPRVDMDAEGSFVLLANFLQNCTENDSSCPFFTATFFDQSGNPINQVTQDQLVTQDKLGRVSSDIGARIAMDADGDTIATWLRDLTNLSNSTVQTNVYARRLRGFEKIDLSLKKKDLADPVRRGDVIDYRLRVNNRHPRLHPTGYKSIDRAIGAASGVKLTDWIPNGAVLLSAKGSGWSCKVHGKHPQCYRNQALWPGDHATINLKLRAPKYGNKVVNHAKVGADQDDPNPNNNRAYERTFLTPH